MAKIKALGLVDSVPIKTKYEPIINHAKKYIGQLKQGKILEVELERASESMNLRSALNKHIEEGFRVSVRTEGETVKGYVRWESNEQLD